MQRPQPMNRLLQGDVGAGKTIVALLAALVAMENGLQVAFMAPTEILAEQHYRQHRAAAGARRASASRCSPAATPRRCSSDTLLAEIERGDDRTWSSARTRWCRSDVQFHAARPRRHRRAASVRRAAARDAAREGAASRRAGDDGDADPAHAGADRLRRSRRVGDSRAAAGPPADQDAGQAGIAARRGLRSSSASELDAGRQAYVIYPLVEESEKVDLQGGDRDGRPPAGGGLSGVPGRRCCTAG